MAECLLVERLDSRQWDGLVSGFRDLSYRQCSSYAEEAAKRVGAASELNCILTEQRQLIGLAEVRTKSAPMTPWGIAYANYAPMFMRKNGFSEADFGRCLDALRDEYVGRRGYVLRVVPPPNTGFPQKPQASCLEERGFQLGSAKPRHTILLDLSTTLEDIRRKFHPKWRSSLVRAEKNGIRIIRSTDLNDFDHFNRIFLEFTKKKGFWPDQDVEFFKRVQTRAGCDQKLVLHLAWEGEQLIAGHLGSYVGDTAVNLLSAANTRGRDLLASFLLQWSVITYAKGRGVRHYDLGGIDKKGNPGVYLFKRRLNGRPFTEPGPYEIAPDPVSGSVIRLAEAVRGAVRHLPQLVRSK